MTLETFSDDAFCLKTINLLFLKCFLENKVKQKHKNT